MLYGNFKQSKTLEMAPTTRWLIEEHSKEAKKYCNGVGSTSTWLNRLLWHLTPNTIWGMSIVSASQVHDIEYSYPTVFRTKGEALRFKMETDIRFHHNMILLIARKYKWYNKFLAIPRLNRAKLYYEAVSHFGMDAFIKNKKILE